MAVLQRFNFDCAQPGILSLTNQRQSGDNDLGLFPTTTHPFQAISGIVQSLTLSPPRGLVFPLNVSGKSLVGASESSPQPVHFAFTMSPREQCGPGFQSWYLHTWHPDDHINPMARFIRNARPILIRCQILKLKICPLSSTTCGEPCRWEKANDSVIFNFTATTSVLVVKGSKF